jgi:hypothetical protein
MFQCNKESFTKYMCNVYIAVCTCINILDWVVQTSIKFKSRLNLKCKLIQCTFQVNLSVN